MEYQGQNVYVCREFLFHSFSFLRKDNRISIALPIMFINQMAIRFTETIRDISCQDLFRERDDSGKKARGNLYVACVIWNRKLDSVSYVGRFDCLFSWEKCKRHAYSNLTDLVKNVSSFDESNSHWRTIETENEMQKWNNGSLDDSLS